MYNNEQNTSQFLSSSSSDTKHSIGIDSAKNLAHIQGTPVQIPYTTPRLLLKALEWLDVENGILQINQVNYLSDIKKQIAKPTSQINFQDYYFLSDLLKSVPLFRVIPDDLIKEILQGLYQKTVNAGDVIVKEGELGNKFYIVTEGQFDVSIEIQKKPSIIKSLGSGDYFGEMALIDDSPRRASIIAASKGSLLCLNKETFAKIVNHPDLKQQLQEAFKNRKRELELSYYSATEVEMPLISGHIGEPLIPQTYANYVERPKQIHLSLVQVVIGLHTRINDLYNSCAHNQLGDQLKVAIENIEERVELEIINNKQFGLLAAADPDLVIQSGDENILDELDQMLSLVWKNPSFFVAHPKIILKLSKAATALSLSLQIVNFQGHNCISWRGVPILPSSKMPVSEGGSRPLVQESDRGGQEGGSAGQGSKAEYSDVILLRTGLDNQGVVGLHKLDVYSDIVVSNGIKSLAIKEMGINQHSIENYLLTKYFSVAILVPDALAVLKNVRL